MLDENEFYIVMKLTSGEQVMAVLKEEDDDHVLLESPMCIRTIPILDANREHITAQPLCQFSDDRSFVIAKRDIMFVKKLHHVFIPHYQRIVKDHEDSTLFIPAGQEDALDWDEEESEEEEIDWKEKLKFLVDGNETLN